MIKFNKESHYFLWLVTSVVISFCIGYVHHKWFYPLNFHGDSAAMHVLAKAILDEGSLLPKDFSYGNQIILLRSSPFIALASLFGFAGYDAFVVGSSLSIALWGGILYLFLKMLFTSRKQALLFSVLLLIPFGGWETDFVLGQQSHLSNAVISLGVVTSVFRFIKDKKYLFIFFSCACIFLLSLESPIRGLLVIGPAFFVIALMASGFKHFFMVTIPMGFSFLIAYVTNKIITSSRPIALNYFNTLTFKSSNETINNLATTTRETVAGISSLNILSGEVISLFGGVVFFLGLVVVACYFIFTLMGAINATAMVKNRLKPARDGVLSFGQSSISFVHLFAIVGLIFGALAVATLNPDSSRHYLWSIFLGKLVILKWFYDSAIRFVGAKLSNCLILVSALLVSVWFASLVKLHWITEDVIKNRNFTTAVNDIKIISKNTGIENVYGEDFWRMMPLNSLIDGINSQALLDNNGELYPYSWLTRPSWSCADGNVLYYLKDGAIDKLIQDKLIHAKGNKIKSGNGYSIWVGPRVWHFPSGARCFESQLVYEDDSLSRLPGTVGIVNDGRKTTENKAGFLVFGPYSSLKQGSYELSVFGLADLISGAYVDVVSSKGKLVHAHFNLKKIDGEFLLKNTVIQIPENVSDIEVRVWVSEHDKLELSGYELKPNSR